MPTDSAAFLGIDQVLHDEQGEQHQQKAHGEGSQLLDAGSAQGAAHDILAAGGQLHLGGGDGNVEDLGVGARVEVADNVLHDLAEGQGHDGQIVAPQPQDRYADEESDDTGKHAAAEHGQQQPQEIIGNGILQKRRDDNSGKSADAHKAGMAQTQLTADTNQQVQGYGQRNVDADGNQQALHGAAQHSGRVGSLHHDEGDDNHKIGHEVGAGGLVVQNLFHNPHLTPFPESACPAGQRASPAE